MNDKDLNKNIIINSYSTTSSSNNNNSSNNSNKKSKIPGPAGRLPVLVYKQYIYLFLKLIFFKLLFI